jgi:hypothetical protein
MLQTKRFHAEEECQGLMIDSKGSTYTSSSDGGHIYIILLSSCAN